MAARRALAAASAAADELSEAVPEADGDDVLAALDAVQVRLGDGLPRGRVRIVRIGLARLAPVRALVLCGLEEGVLPRREPAEAAGSAELRRALTPAGLPVTGRGRRSAIASCSRRRWRASTSISCSCAARPTTTASSSLPRRSGTRSCACSATRRRSP